MWRFGRVLCCLAFSGLVGGLAVPPAAAHFVSRIYFDPPHDGNTWHRGAVMRARIEPAAAIPGGLDNPVLELVIGANTREVPGRLYQNGSRGQFYYPVRSEDAAAPDEVRMAKVTLAGQELDLSSFTPETWAVDGGSDGVAPIIDGIGLSSFFVPSNNEYRPGEDIYWFARFHKDVVVGGAPVLTQRIGDKMREAGYRPDVVADVNLPGAIYFTYTVRCSRTTATRTAWAFPPTRSAKAPSESATARAPPTGRTPSGTRRRTCRPTPSGR